MSQIRSAALIGLGAMGVFFAPRMEKYLGKYNFTVIADGERKARLENQGVTINGKNYRFSITEPRDGKPMDLIIMAVKDMGLARAIEDIEKFVGDTTQILCVMNGVESEQKVAKVYGLEHVLYSFMRMSIVMKDGKADFDPYWGKIHFGEEENRIPSERVHRVEDFMKACDIPYCIEEDMIGAMWFKYMCNIGENMTCALLGIPFGAFRMSDAANRIRIAAMYEVLAIAKKLGVNLSEKQIEQQNKTVLTIPPKNKPSTLQDLEAGKKTEVEMFAGYVVRKGRELGVPTPINEIFLDGIHVLEEKAKNHDFA